jgi:hypothetical protein
MRIRQAFTEYAPTRGIAMILGLGMVAWGLLVVAPPVSFVGASYALMNHLATEAVWGGFMLFGGITMSYGTFSADVEWIRNGAFLGFCIWLLLAVLGFVSDPNATATITRTIVALMHAWVYVQVKIHPYLVTGKVKVTDLYQYVQEKNIGGNHNE